MNDPRSSSKQSPTMLNVLICGTPGTGKSTLVNSLRCRLPHMNYINLSEWAIKEKCISGYDSTLDCHEIDEKLLRVKIKPILKNRANIIEHHHAELFPEDLIDLVFVCRTDNTKLFDRLMDRGYSSEKVSNNVQAEIFRLIYDEALNYYGQEKVIELSSNEATDIEANVRRILDAINDAM